MKQSDSSYKTKFVTLAIAGTMLLSPALPVVGLAAQAYSNSSYVTLSSFSGTPAVALQLSGGGFAASETINIVAVSAGNRVLTATTKATVNGDLNYSLQLPAKLAQGALAITATGQTSGTSASNSYYVTPFTPSLSTSASETTPYGTLTISGKGYAPNEKVSLNLAGAVTTAQADAKGAFSGATIVTPAVPAASYTLVGVGQDSAASATSYIYVNGFFPGAAPTSYYVLPATELGFNGNGFAANETVKVSDATSGIVLSQFKTDATGGFKNGGAFTVPATYAGQSANFVLTGTLSQASTSVNVTIGQYFPSITPSAHYVLPGAQVSFDGQGFMPNETVNVLSGTTKLATTTADKYGNVSTGTTVTVPVEAAGSSRSYTLTGVTSQGSGSVSIQVGAFSAQVSPSSYYALPGSTLTFSGIGFAPNETVGVYSGTQKVATIKADAAGTFIAAGGVTVGYDLANKSASYSLKGDSSKASADVTIGVGQMATELTPSDYYVLPYSPFSVTASGFAKGETVTLRNGSTVIASATTDQKGTAVFNGVSLPPSKTNSADLTATGTTSKAVAAVNIAMGNYHPSVTASEYYVQPGSKVTLQGNGFAPNETVSIAVGGTTTIATADKSGAVKAIVTVPYGSKTTSLDIVSTGTLSGAVHGFALTLAPYNVQVSPSTYYAQPGSPVSFTGSGYVAGETVTISQNGSLLASVKADSKGNLATPGYALPYGKTASYNLSGTTSGATSDFTVTLAQFYAGIQLDSYYGNGGSTVTVSGNGFAANETVTLHSGTAVLGTAKADSKGAFSLATAMPYGKPGKAVITATGSLSGASAETSYTLAQVYTSAYLGSYAVPAGKAVTLMGSGYLKGEPIVVTADRGPISYGLSAGPTGTFSNSGLILPASLPEGELTLTITGQFSYTTHQITLYVQHRDAK